MIFILLTGSGFSSNWGGPLASEVFSSLLADRDIDEATRDRLFAAEIDAFLPAPPKRTVKNSAPNARQGPRG